MIATLNGVRLSFIDEGQGQTILFVHGFPLSRAIWQPQIEAFVQNYRVIAPDLRGHGESSAPAGVYAMATLAEDLQALVAERQCGPVVLVGHSMGGYISFAFYRKFPQSVRALVLFCTRAIADSAEGKMARENLAQRSEQEGAAAVAAQMLPKMFAPATAIARPALVESVRTVMLATSINGLTGSLRGMAARPSALDLLPHITVPTLVIAGENDLIVPASESAALAEAIPQAQLAMIPRAGHLASLENAAAVIVPMQEFLEKI
ncbi:MAG: 3-oxoadipate enol-lactonase 2 [bacterium]|nr:3-oxoadipate enol-lactonase 2 [bacterium]